MEDIYWIYTLIFWFLYSNAYLIILWSLLFLSVYYLLLKEYFSPREENTQKLAPTSSFENIFSEKYHHLVLLAQSGSRGEFFRELYALVVLYYFYKFQKKSILTATLQDLTPYLSQEHRAFIKEIYFMQYVDIDDTVDERLKYLKQLSHTFWRKD